MNKLSVIMPSFLGEYDGCASNRDRKFCRAVNSFLNQTYENKELIVVSDGCKQTILLLKEHFYDKILKGIIKCVMVKKQPMFSGYVRAAGVKMATGQYILYLDTDDELGINHLANFNEQIGYYDWVYWDDTIRKNGSDNKRMVELHQIQCGTSTIGHSRDMKSSWSGCNGYGHDWIFICKLVGESGNYAKIENMEYYVRHMPNDFES